ncbi:MAG: hypothetical protein ABH812_03000 [bacterium]
MRIEALRKIAPAIALATILSAGCGNDSPVQGPDNFPISAGSIAGSTSPTTITEAPTTTTEIPKQDRFRYYAKDFQEAYPELSVGQITTELKHISGLVSQIDPLNFIANETNSGIERDPENGHVIDYEGPITINVPEGGYAYLSHGHGTLTAPDGFQIELPWKENNVYLTYIRGVQDDRSSEDLNQGWKFEDFATGFVWKQHAADTRHIDTQGQIINLEQISQDVLYAAKSGTNCGATGCEYTITMDFIDAKGIRAEDENAWMRVTYFPTYGDNGDVLNLAYVGQNMITGEPIPQTLNNS